MEQGISLPEWWGHFDEVHALNMALGLVRNRINELPFAPEPWDGANDFARQVWGQTEATLTAMVRTITESKDD